MNPFMPFVVNLDVFVGPFDFLVHLVQKSEIDPSDVSLKVIIENFLLKDDRFSLDSGAEFIGSASSLLWLKSRALLPKNEIIDSADEQEDCVNFDLVHQLLDYCRFKEAAKDLSRLEQQQKVFYPRGSDPSIDVKKPLGIDHISLEELAVLFQEVLQRTKIIQGHIQDEDWKVSDKITDLRNILKSNPFIPFRALFRDEISRLELIVIFLALLELMKSGEVKVARDESQQILITKQSRHENRN